MFLVIFKTSKMVDFCFSFFCNLLLSFEMSFTAVFLHCTVQKKGTYFPGRPNLETSFGRGYNDSGKRKEKNWVSRPILQSPVFMALHRVMLSIQNFRIVEVTESLAQQSEAQVQVLDLCMSFVLKCFNSWNWKEG